MTAITTSAILLHRIAVPEKRRDAAALFLAEEGKKVRAVLVQLFFSPVRSRYGGGRVSIVLH